MSAEHVRVCIERYSFVQQNGDIEEYVAYVLQNNGDSPFPLSGKYLKHDFTDSVDTVLSVSDGLEAYGGCLYGSVDGIFRVGLELRGDIAPHGTRIIGAHVRRRKLADAQPDEAHLEDPLRIRSLSAFPGATLDALVVYVFPADDLRRKVVATGAKYTTTRLARWDYTPQPDVLERWRAKSQDATLPPATYGIDDAIAEIYRVVAADAAGTAHDTSEAIRFLDEIPEDFRKAAADARQFLSEYWTHIFEQRQLRARQIALTIHSLRDRIAVAPIPQDAKHLDVLRFTTQAVLNKVSEHSIPSPPPRSLTTVVSHLLRFADSCRRGDPFDKSVREQDFHRRLRTFLQGANGPVESEVQMGRGRIDILLDDTPIELKAQKLGKNPAQGVSRHIQQAANYAADRRVSAGVLVILDLTDRTSETQHGAPLPRNIDVLAVPSRPAIGGKAYTALVVLVIEAFPPNPSSLGVKNQRRKSARSPRTRTGSSLPNRREPRRKKRNSTSRA